MRLQGSRTMEALQPERLLSGIEEISRQDQRGRTLITTTPMDRSLARLGRVGSAKAKVIALQRVTVYGEIR
jgi:hypothetical protein